MVSIRTPTAGAIVSALLLSGVTVSGALAETASWETSGHRVLLLKIVEQSAPSAALHTASYAKSGTTKPLKRQQLGARRWIRGHNRLAEKHRLELTKIARAHVGEEIRPAADAAAPPIDLEAPPRELAVDVRPMRVASSRELDEIDLQGTQTLLQANSEVANRLADSFASISNLADTTGVSEFPSVAVAQQLRGGKPTGAPWMLQMLATLGGAATAGSIAWFLISPTRERRFG
jgi:hypothetical protein